MVTSLRLLRRRRSQRRENRWTVRNIRRHEDCELAIRWSASSVARRSTNPRAPTENDLLYYLRRSCEPCLHDQVRGSEKNIIDCRACRHRTGKESRCVVVWIGGAVDLYILFDWTYASIYCLIYFRLNFVHRLSTVWYILVRKGNEAVRSWADKRCRYIAN